MGKGTRPDCHLAPHPSTWRWKVRGVTGVSGGFAEGRPPCRTCSQAAAGHCHTPRGGEAGLHKNPAPGAPQDPGM